MFKIVALNTKTLEKLEWFGYSTREDAQYDIDNNLEWDEDDVIEDWKFSIEEYEEDEEPADIDDDFGFDPYLGCCTYDCQEEQYVRRNVIFKKTVKSHFLLFSFKSRYL